MAENYPTWEQVEKKLTQFWADSYPIEKIIEVKQTKKDLEIGTERVDNSVVEYQHVYYYGETIVTKPDGGKYLYPMRIAFYQIPGQTQWNFHYASPGTHKVLEEGKGEDPLKPTQEKFRDILKQYVELMVSKHFPASKWTDYCKANNVELKITKVDYKNPAEVADSLRFADTENPISFTFFVEGTYKDKAGSFKFRIENLNPAFRANLDGGFWGMGYHAKPVDQLTTNDLSELKQYLLETAEEPRKALEQYIPEASPMEKALALMMDEDPNKRCDGIEELKWIQGVENDEMVVDTLIGLLNDQNQTVVEYANSALDTIYAKTTSDAIKQKSKEAGDPIDQALVKLQNQDPNVRIQACEVLYSYVKDIADDPNIVNALLMILQTDQDDAVVDASYKVLEKIKFQTQHPGIQQTMKILDYLKCSWMLRSPEEAGTAWGKIDKNLLKTDPKTMMLLIAILQKGASVGYSTRILEDIKAWLDTVRAYDKDKISPEILAKINETLGVVSTGPKDKASAPATSAAPAQQVDEYAQATADFKDPKKAMYAVRKIKGKREYNEKIVKDDAAMESLINIWLKKGEFDSSARSEVRAFLDGARSYSKDKLNPDVLKKIEEAFKTVRS